MSDKKAGRGKETAIRIMCFALGVLLTLSGVLIRERYPQLFGGMMNKETEEEAEDSLTTEVEETVANAVHTIEVPEPTEQALLKAKELEKEAEEQYKEMVAAAEQVTPTVSVIEENKTYEIDGKESKVNWNTDWPALSEEHDLQWHADRETSYDNTLKTNAFDKMVIENSTVDFSGVKIAILGDSITAATNIKEDEDREKYNYPQILSDILGCEVVNLGIGGSVVSRAASNWPMVERWSDIPDDSDIVIIFGGTNDCLFQNKWEFGNIAYEQRMTKGTFCGDLDEMCSGIKWKFTDNISDRYVKLIYINPMSTILNDGVYATDPGNMVEQSTFAEAINAIVPEYGFDVIDLYNQNFLNSHDPDVNHTWITDGVHPNPEGYQILAEHIASQIIQRVNQ